MPNRPRPRPGCIPGIGRDPVCARAWSALARTRARQDAGAPGNGDPTPTPTPTPEPVFGSLAGWSNDDYLSREAAVWPGQVPFLMSIWAKRTAMTTNVVPMMHLGQTLAANHSRALLHNNGFVGAKEQLTGAVTATTSAGAGLDTWYHAAAAFVLTQVPDGANLREAWQSGGSKGTNTGNAGGAGVNAPTVTAIGPVNGSPETHPRMTEASIWDIAGFSEADRQALVTRLATLVEGLIPSAEDVNADEGEPWTGKLVAYWPLFDLEDGLLDHSGNGHHMTASGSLTVVEDHPNL